MRHLYFRLFIVVALTASASSIPCHGTTTETLGITGNITCEYSDGPVCDAGTVSVTLNGPGSFSATRTVNYNGLGLYNLSSDPGTAQAIADAIAAAFNSISGSPVSADSSGAQCSEGSCTGITFTSSSSFQICVTVTSNYATTDNPYAQGLEVELKPSNYPYFFTPSSGVTYCN